MNDASIGQPPADLRRAIAADLAPVLSAGAALETCARRRAVRGRAAVAALLIFQFRRSDALGGLLSWGASLAQAVAGVALVAAALRESVPGRNWSAAALSAIAAGALALVTAVTVASWHASPVTLGRGWLTVGLILLVASAFSALPATIVAALLALGAMPTRPAVAGLLAGLGGGLMADAGWLLVLPLLGSAARARVASRWRRLRRACRRGAHAYSSPRNHGSTEPLGSTEHQGRHVGIDSVLPSSVPWLVGFVLGHAEPVALAVLHHGLMRRTALPAGPRTARPSP